MNEVAECSSSRTRPMVTTVVAALSLLAILVTTDAAAHAAQAFDDCLPSQVRLSITQGGSAFTGGSYPVSVVLRNVSKVECSVEGHPQVVVAPQPFPIVIGDVADFDRNDPYIGPERLLHVMPRHRVSAQVIIGRRCAGDKSEMTTATIAFTAYHRSISLRIPACRRQGAVVYTGPFMPVS
jgi:hypothetical protein